MSDILIRNLSPATVEFWKRRAAKHRRSLQAEIATVLDEAVEQGADSEVNHYAEFAAHAAALRKLTEGTAQSDSTDIIREDRDTDHGHQW
jgi:plasmid stability protein